MTASLTELIAAFHEAKVEYDAEAEQTGFCDGPAYEAYEAAEDAIVRHPCQTIDEVRAKARFFIANSGPYDTIRNCFDAREETLLPFLRSLTGGAS